MDPRLAHQLDTLGIDPKRPERTPGALHALLQRVSATYTSQRRSRAALKRAMAASMQHPGHGAAETSFERLFEIANDAMFTLTVDGLITSANQALADLTGLTRGQLRDRPLSSLVTASSGDDMRAMRRRKLKDPGAVTRYEVDFVREDGAIIPVELSTQLVIVDGYPVAILGVARDVSERRARETALRDQAERDSLTGLPNRAKLLQELIAAVSNAAMVPAALAMVDLDRFKQINDSLGHEAGDEVLISVAHAMSTAAEGHTVARMSGDEFVILMRGVDLEGAAAIAERVRGAVAHAHVRVRGERVHPQVSIGITSIAADSAAPEVLATADAALYDAKHQGRNRVVVGAPTPFRRRERDDFATADAVFEAIADDRLELLYQPIVNLETSTTIAYEALVRMRDTEGQLVPPGRFLSAMEHVGGVPTIDRCVAALVLQTLRQHRAMRIFMNVSPSTIADASVFDYLEAAFTADPQLAPRLEIEITEAAAMLDVEFARSWLQRLRDWGCGIALDDFGTGYSFLHLVRDLPITTIKIDGSSILAFVDDPKERALVRSLQTLADGLGVTTVAEWIETPAQLELARSLGITRGQGYLLGEPMPLAQITAAMTRLHAA